jgi:DNA-binding IclR family transcriptional regulator
MTQSPVSETAAEGSAVRTLDVLEFLARRSTPASAATIAEACSIPRSSLYALLGTLKQRRYVAYHAKERSWSLGPAAHELSAEAPLFAHGLAVLRALATAPGGLTEREMALRGELPRPAVDGILPYLTESDLVRPEGDGMFTLGLELVSLASRLTTVDHLRIMARPVLAELRDATNETASLIIEDGDSALYLDQVESPYTLRIGAWVGRRIPLGGTATGAALANPGICQVVEGAVEPGVIAVACALVIPDQSAAVNILAPSWRLNEFGVERACGMVESAARQISQRVRDDRR